MGSGGEEGCERFGGLVIREIALWFCSTGLSSSISTHIYFFYPFFGLLSRTIGNDYYLIFPLFISLLQVNEQSSILLYIVLIPTFSFYT